MSYAQFAARICAMTMLLRGRGIGTGDRIAVCAFNRIEVLELLFACGHLGAILVPVNNRLTAPEAHSAACGLGTTGTDLPMCG